MRCAAPASSSRPSSLRWRHRHWCRPWRQPAATTKSGGPPGRRMITAFSPAMSRPRSSSGDGGSSAAQHTGTAARDFITGAGTAADSGRAGPRRRLEITGTAAKPLCHNFLSGAARGQRKSGNLYPQRRVIGCGGSASLRPATTAFIARLRRPAAGRRAAAIVFLFRSPTIRSGRTEAMTRTGIAAARPSAAASPGHGRTRHRRTCARAHPAAEADEAKAKRIRRKGR
jgi:hypothetical protein